MKEHHVSIICAEKLQGAINRCFDSIIIEVRHPDFIHKENFVECHTVSVFDTIIDFIVILGNKVSDMS